MKKANFKATLIMLIYTIAGAIGSIILGEMDPTGYVLGFPCGVATLWVSVSIWSEIRNEIVEQQKQTS